MQKQSPRRYIIKEIFYSLQGEGIRAGTANVFVRFAGCNLSCTKAVEGFDCDTDFSGGMPMTSDEIFTAIDEFTDRKPVPIVWTGGEPALQLDSELTAKATNRGHYQAVETNGTLRLPSNISWIAVSPKRGHALQIASAHEARYVLSYGMTPPDPQPVAALYNIVSPAYEENGELLDANLKWCVDICKKLPTWRLSIQQHKEWGIR